MKWTKKISPDTKRGMERVRDKFVLIPRRSVNSDGTEMVYRFVCKVKVHERFMGLRLGWCEKHIIDKAHNSDNLLEDIEVQNQSIENDDNGGYGCIPTYVMPETGSMARYSICSRDGLKMNHDPSGDIQAARVSASYASKKRKCFWVVKLVRK